VRKSAHREKVRARLLVLNKYGKQFGKNIALHHVETNAIGADKY